MTFSRGDQLWYDIDSGDLQIWEENEFYERHFVLFALGTDTEILVIPVSLLKTLTASLTPAGDGSYKLHVEERAARIFFKEAPAEDLSQ